MAPRDLDIQSYKVGWVCALAIELAAAEEMLDERHPNLPQHHRDNNNYTLGRIGRHNVVIACLPAGQMGNNAATTVVSQMHSMFHDIRFTLMVGIGGGVPSAVSDIRLGDVVISEPQSQYGGVVQYDFGKNKHGYFERTGCLRSPPAFLLSAVSKLKANHIRQVNRIPEYLDKIVKDLPSFAPQQTGSDVLFKSDYVHIGGKTCDQCNKDKTVPRDPRPGNKTTIHYGTIASGNQVMKNGIERDRLCADLGGVLCFEMEAAGLMNTAECLIIRGICDYSDSHKNDSWQPYAAAIAAACAKDLLSVVPTVEGFTANSEISIRAMDEWTQNGARNDPDVSQIQLPGYNDLFPGRSFGAQEPAWRSDINISSRTYDNRSLDIKRLEVPLPGGLNKSKLGWRSDENLISSASASVSTSASKPPRGIRSLFGKRGPADKASQERIKSLEKELKQTYSKGKGEMNLETLAMAEMLADIYRDQGKIDKALDWYRDIYDVKKEQLGRTKSDPDMRATRNSIGKCCEMKGWHKEASQWLN